MKVAITGASGLVGRALCASLDADGVEVLRLVRREAADGEARWDPATGEFESEKLAGCDAVVHLAGDGVAEGRWTAAKKARIRSSRVEGTELLVRGLLEMPVPPPAFISASAVGYYGDRGDDLVGEDDPQGDDFLGGVCHAWEQAAEPARAAGLRVVHLRIGLVLAADGGALTRMLTPFKMCLGGRIGNGRQWMSWVALEDLVRMFRWTLDDASMSGVFNAVAPQPVTNLEFTKTLGRVLGRPTVFPMPAFAARLAFGEMADGLLLASQRVLPRRLQETGFSYRHETLEGAMRAVLVRP